MNIEQSISRFRDDSADESGFWRTCSGCYESEDGHDVGNYPFSPSLGCKLGSGCGDCGGLGATWDTVDYAQMAADMLADDNPTIITTGAVLDEIERALRKFPTWPTDPLHALAVLGEEFGELTRAALQSVYEPHKVTSDDLRSEAVQTAAMALRFVASLDRYRFEEASQHKQVLA